MTYGLAALHRQQQPRATGGLDMHRHFADSAITVRVCNLYPHLVYPTICVRVAGLGCAERTGERRAVAEVPAVRQASRACDRRANRSLEYHQLAVTDDHRLRDSRRGRVLGPIKERLQQFLTTGCAWNVVDPLQAEAGVDRASMVGDTWSLQRRL